MLNRHRHPAGFSLIELMVAVAVLGILIVVGIPAFSSWIANAQVRTVADGLLNGLSLARAEASRRNRSVQFKLSTSTSGLSWQLNRVPVPGLIDPTTGAVESSSDPAIQTAALGNAASNIVVAVTQGSTAQSLPFTLTFNSYGYVSGGSAVTTYTVTRIGSDHPLNVTVSVGGQVRTCDPGISLSSSPEGCS